VQRTTACVLSLLLALSGAAMATTSPDGSLPPSSMTVAPGTTFTDLAPAPNSVRDGLNLDPCEAPEGDYLGAAIFTRDGQRVLLTNRLTDNVTVYDAEGNTLTAVSCPRAHTRGLMPVVRCPWSILPKEGCHAIVCYWSAAV